MSQPFTLESIELLGQSKLQIGETKKQKKTYLVGELRRQSPIDWRVYRAQFPKLERSQNTKLFSSLYSKDQFAICWWSQNLNSCMCTIKSSTFELPQLQVLQKKTWQHGKNKTLWAQNGICWLIPLFVVFFSSSNFFTAWCGCMVDRFFTQPVYVLHASIFQSAKSEKVALAGFAWHSLVVRQPRGSAL